MTDIINYDSVLIANRGEIALRITATVRKLGLRTVAVFSTADAKASHVEFADEAVEIGGALPAESYLNIAAIIDAAVRTNCQAIHPGYGFLSENPEFADRCAEAGLIFIGPKSESLRAMGHKDAAKQRMIDAGVPVVPGYHGEQQDADFLFEQAALITYPLLIKARAGGGGKGMRLVATPSEFQAALASARREAAGAFGDDHVLLEKYIMHPRHIEVQVFGDRHGNVVHLYERDCSIQRRHQKVIEESPAPGITDAFRLSLCTAAVTAASSINYEGAGTIEFIVDASGAMSAKHFWFMEMNTRLQVEHPVTESVTGLDLVEWQLVVADGQTLPLQQQDIQLNGHSVEARIYAEDVPAGFLPATGCLDILRWPADGRIDSGVVQGDKVLPFYDPMLAKLIATGGSRAQAFKQLSTMLRDTVMLGTITNRDFLLRLCSHDAVLSGDVSTTLIEEQIDDLVEQMPSTKAIAIAAMACSLWPSTDVQTDIATTLGTWQLWGQARRLCELCLDERDRYQATTLTLEQQADHSWLVSAANFSHRILPIGIVGWNDGSEAEGRPAEGRPIEIDGRRLHVHVLNEREYLDIHVGECSARVYKPMHHKSTSDGKAHVELMAAMPGLITQISCTEGQAVRAGLPLLSQEAMKMEQTLNAPHDVVIAEICVTAGQQVSQGQVLVRFEIDGNSANNEN
ncbi:MAG: biotin carboxylase N-terminal domain-containing protein [Granulosicoccaceae bacterium]